MTWRRETRVRQNFCIIVAPISSIVPNVHYHQIACRISIDIACPAVCRCPSLWKLLPFSASLAVNSASKSNCKSDRGYGNINSHWLNWSGILDFILNAVLPGRWKYCLTSIRSRNQDYGTAYCGCFFRTWRGLPASHIRPWRLPCRTQSGERCSLTLASLRVVTDNEFNRSPRVCNQQSWKSTTILTSIHITKPWPIIHRQKHISGTLFIRSRYYTQC